jgi:hypothetical protein
MDTTSVGEVVERKNVVLQVVGVNILAESNKLSKDIGGLMKAERNQNRHSKRKTVSTKRKESRS